MPKIRNPKRGPMSELTRRDLLVKGTERQRQPRMRWEDRRPG
jgi:hypothetical protein